MSKFRAFRSLWGVIDLDGGRKPLRQFVEETAAHGKYAGVECSLKLARVLEANGHPFEELLNAHGLQWIPIVFSSGPVWGGWSPFLEGAPTAAAFDPLERHLEALRAQIVSAKESRLSIPFINAHTGHDSFTDRAAEDIFRACQDLGDSLGVQIVHEIHRGRATASPWLLQRILPRLPDVRLVADYSHFLAACEVDPGDGPLESALEAIHGHVHHVHARIGYDNGPQVTDPRTPEWSAHVEAHIRWWKAVWRAQKASGRQTTASVTPEHGPFPYQHVFPLRFAIPVGVKTESINVARMNTAATEASAPLSTERAVSDASDRLSSAGGGEGARMGNVEGSLSVDLEAVNEWVLQKAEAAFTEVMAEGVPP